MLTILVNLKLTGRLNELFALKELRVIKSGVFTPVQWDNTVVTIKFPRAACRECQFRHLCTRSSKEPREINVRSKEEHLAIVKRRKQQKTKAWSKKYNQRAGVEGTISQGIRGFGLRECRYAGLDKVHLQHILTATAMNAVRLFARE